MSETIQDISIEELVAPYDDTDDGQEHFRHVVRPIENAHIDIDGVKMEGLVDLARMQGTFLVALCGYRWTPKRNPTKYPTCPACLERVEEIMGE